MEKGGEQGERKAEDGVVIWTGDRGKDVRKEETMERSEIGQRYSNEELKDGVDVV